MTLGPLAAVVGLLLAASSPVSGGQTPVRGLTAAAVLSGAYDAVLNADFDAVAARLSPACPTVPAWCDVMTAVSVWWQIALDPDDHTHDGRFEATVETAIVNAEAWTSHEPDRAEAWFARGAAYATRAQFRVLRGERLAAARDGKRIKGALERALAIDPTLHDAKFGLGMYHYYADVAPGVVRLLRWLLLLPGGDRTRGLQEMIDARDQGLVIGGEASYQLHLVYLWYEERSRDALSILRDLQRRYPRNPLFQLAEADIHDAYFHDRAASERTLKSLVALADAGRMNAPTIAKRRAAQSLKALDARTKR
jgi:hypothetical protein